MCSRRFPLFVLSLFLALLLVPSRALAYDFIPKGLAYSADLEGSRYGAVVVAANQFDAACYALGKEPASISTSMRSKLSDPNYGGRFYDFSQAFYTQGWPLEEVPEWLPIYVWGSLEWSDLLLSDYQSVWYVTCTQSLRSGALSDFLAVLNGEDLSGGGGGSGDVENVFPMALTDNGRNVQVYSSSFEGVRLNIGGQYYYVNDCYYGNESHSRNAPSVNLAFNSSLLSRYQSLVSSNPNLKLYVVGKVSSGSLDVQGLLTDAPMSIVDSGTYRTISFPYNTSSYHYYLLHNSSGKAFGGGYMTSRYDSASGAFVLGLSSFSNCTGVNSRKVPSGSANEYYFFGESSVGPPPPAGTWPEPSTPAAPVEPTFPDPVTPTVQPDPVVTEPTVTWPSPTITIDPDPVPGTTPTGLDYTELLTRINDNLISIDSFARAINSNFNSLRSDLVNEFNGVVQGLRNVYTYLQHMDGVLERHCVHLQNKMEDVSVDIQNKMRELFHWLAEQLDFDSESSGNSDLFGILSTINDKLGGGTYEPNPLKDENAYYEWLDDLWDRFLLGDNWQNSASSMSQSFGQLTSRFPFSVPWDIVALFRLFVHDPVTPVFDLPLYYSSEDSATVRVDLSAWDGVASVVRPLVFVIFALKLALLSRHLLAGFGADKGGL